ncbi:MAG TPA: hypothetical protein VMS98_01520 [Thermoanaerobaculia bacterium]|nr:hypothetical protein [Thermoanaerobaculia bacterium]
MKAVEENAASLQEHMAQTYVNLRIGIAIIAIALPILLWAGGLVLGSGGLLESMSAYYHSVMRDTFVGALVAIGLFLYLYKGFSTKENWALNGAGVFAVVIAMVATSRPETPAGVESHVHNASAVLFFLCIAYVAIFRASDTLSLIGDPQRAASLRTKYRTLGWFMVASPLLAVVLTYVLDRGSRGRSFVFFVETVAVWTFATYWLLKSREIRETGAEGLALEAKIEASPTPPTPASPGCLVRVA